MTAFVDAVHALDAVHGAHGADDNVLLPDNSATDVDAALDDELVMIMHEAQRPADEYAFLDALHELDAAFEEPDACALMPENTEAEAAALLDQELADELTERRRALDDEHARRLRIARMVEQARDDSVPLLERACVICMDPLDDETEGPPITLPCHRLHCFHAHCVAAAWERAPDARSMQPSSQHGMLT